MKQSLKIILNDGLEWDITACGLGLVQAGQALSSSIMSSADLQSL